MTLAQFFDYLSSHPSALLWYYIALPIIACLTLLFGKGVGHTSPWKYVYSLIVYLSAIPGLFAVTLGIYLVVFEHRSIMQVDIYTQVLPVISMIVTLGLVRRNVSYDSIPGFEKLSGLLMVIMGLLILLWILEKTHILAITFLPFYMVIGIFVLLLFILLRGWKKTMQ